MRLLVPVIASLAALVAGTGCALPDASPDGKAAEADSAADENAGFVRVAASTFEMGCTPGQSDCNVDETAHSVTLTQDYWVATTEVTQGDFSATMGYNPSIFPDCGTTCPVETVTWHEAAAYTNAVSLEAGLTECYACSGSESVVRCEAALDPYTCDGYRLLTEAEWEGAARCGTDLLYAGSDDILAVGWIGKNSDGTTHIGASLAANACGIYDMSGNVWEWAHDWYGEKLVTASDPSGKSSGAIRSVRGGGVYNVAANARVADRSADYPDTAGTSGVGVRLGRSQL